MISFLAVIEEKSCSVIGNVALIQQWSYATIIKCVVYYFTFSDEWRLYIFISSEHLWLHFLFASLSLASLSCPRVSLVPFYPNRPWPWHVLHKKQMLKALAWGVTTLCQGLWEPITDCVFLIHTASTSGCALPRQTHTVHHFLSKWNVHCSGNTAIFIEAWQANH